MHPISPKGSTALQAVGIALVALVTVAVLLPLDLGVARTLSAAAPYVLAGLFAAGLVSIPARQPALMKSCFIAAALMAVVLRSSVSDVTPERPRYVAPEQTDISVAQVSTGNFGGEAPYGLDEVLDANTDIVCVQQLTPDWQEFLARELGEEFPYQYTYPDIGLQGVGLYARHALGHVDTLRIGGVVHVEACDAGTGATPAVDLLAVQTLPPVNSFAYYRLRGQLDALASRLAATASPIIVLGDFNSVPWSDELQDFQADTELLDSRRSIQSTFVKGAPQLFEVPVEHIFYSRRLRCLNYETMRSADGYLGNRATFQDKSVPTSLAGL